jgi:hypothetical protein
MGRGIRPASALAAAALAVAGTGCGHADTKHAKAPSGTDTIPAAGLPPATSDAPAPDLAPAPATKRRRHRAPARHAHPATSTNASADVPAPPPPSLADAGLAVRRAVSDTLAGLGYAGAKVDVSGGGSVVDVGVRRSQACSRTAPIGDRLVARIREGHPGMHTVRVTVTGTGLALTAYRRARCATAAPAGDGAVVYSKSGTGPLTTPPFTIAARTWTVTYRNDSDFFQASVLKGGRLQPFVLSSTHRGTGTATFHGPGSFQLKVTAGDAWSVSVRDGA